MATKSVRITGLTNDGRLVLAAVAASVMLVHVTLARHVQISLFDPVSYLSLFRHKCGVALVGCSVWLLLELLGVFDTDSRRERGTGGAAGSGRRTAFGSRVLR